MPDPPLKPPGMVSPMGLLFVPAVPASDPYTAPPQVTVGTAFALIPPGLSSPMAWQRQPVVTAADPSKPAPVVQPLTGLFV